MGPRPRITCRSTAPAPLARSGVATRGEDLLAPARRGVDPPGCARGGGGVQALGFRRSAVAGERPPLGRMLAAVAGQPFDLGRDRGMAGRPWYGPGAAGGQVAAALGHEDDAPSRSADSDG